MFSRLVCVVAFGVLAGLQVFAQDIPLTFVSYNCENLFDCSHDSLKDDHEFLPDSEREWTRRRCWRKINAVGRAIHQCGGEGSEWRLPDLVALVEVENDTVMSILSRGSMLRGGGYRYVMTDSEDARGIDVALLYNPFTFRLSAYSSLRITPPKGFPPTRDVLYAKGVVRTGDTLHIFVLHAPSRLNGEKLTEGYRKAVAQRIVSATDSIRSASGNAAIVVAGDFNDYALSAPLRIYSEHGLTDVSHDAVGRTLPKEVRGTYRHNGTWGSLDHILLSASLLGRAKACFVLDNKWLLERDAQGRYKPWRTYLGTFYHGGVSDHLPLVLNLAFPSTEKPAFQTVGEYTEQQKKPLYME